MVELLEFEIQLKQIKTKHLEKPGWKNAVVHVDPEGRADDEVQGESDSHQVSGFVFRQVVSGHVNHSPENKTKMSFRLLGKRVSLHGLEKVSK